MLVILPQTEHCDTLHALIDKLDGIIISGGHDVDATLYGENPLSSSGAAVPARDAQEIEAMQYAYAHTSVPILGICRGVQNMNIAFGGKLYRDIQSEVRWNHPFDEMYPRNCPWHTMTLIEGSRLWLIFDTNEIRATIRQSNRYRRAALY